MQLGSTASIALDTQANELFLADGYGQEVGFFGHYGKQVGQFHNIHEIVTDSKGNVYTGTLHDQPADPNSFS